MYSKFTQKVVNTKAGKTPDQARSNQTMLTESQDKKLNIARMKITFKLK